MYINKLKIKGFKSFYEETEVNFNDINGLYKISGQIGSGKTTLGEAIIYGLYGSVSGKTNSDLISWGEKHGLVELWCQSRNKNIYIRRELNSYGQSPMSVQVDGKPIIFTNKRNAQAQLEQDFLDTPRTTMELLCIISFNNFKSLSTLNTKDTKIFLDQVLGFDILTQYIDICKADKTDLNSQLLSSRANVRAVSSQIERMENYTFINGDPDQIHAEIDALKNEIHNKRTDISSKTQPLTTAVSALNTRLTEIKVLGTATRREIDFIKKGTCPTCGAPIDQSQLSIKEQARENLSKQYLEISAQINDLNAQISSLNQELTNYVTERNNRIKSQENELIKLTEQAKHTDFNKSEINKLKKQVKNLQKEIDDISIKIEQYDRLIQILQINVRSKVLESFIPSINFKIKEIAGMLGLTYIPEYDTMFKCSIKLNGDTISTSSLSTGQLKMVDMIIILAIMGSLVAKINTNILFLDELFSNIDKDTATSLISVLRALLPKDTIVFIVSHQPMVESLFNGEIRMRLVPVNDSNQQTKLDIINL